jgi:hypothetical protein
VKTDIDDFDRVRLVEALSVPFSATWRTRLPFSWGAGFQEAIRNSGETSASAYSSQALSLRPLSRASNDDRWGRTQRLNLCQTAAKLGPVSYHRAGHHFRNAIASETKRHIPSETAQRTPSPFLWAAGFREANRNSVETSKFKHSSMALSLHCLNRSSNDDRWGRTHFPSVDGLHTSQTYSFPLLTFPPAHRT